MAPKMKTSENKCLAHGECPNDARRSVIVYAVPRLLSVLDKNRAKERNTLWWMIDSWCGHRLGHKQTPHAGNKKAVDHIGQQSHTSSRFVIPSFSAKKGKHAMAFVDQHAGKHYASLRVTNWKKNQARCDGRFLISQGDGSWLKQKITLK